MTEKMNNKLMIAALALGLMMTTAHVAAQDSLAAGRTTQPEKQAVKAKRVVKVNGVTVSERPVSDKEKEAAKQMVRQTGKIVGKAAQVAATAISNPALAKQMGKDLEQMGDELDKMGEELSRMDDSLSSLVDDTTFIDETADSVEVGYEVNGLDEDDVDDFFDEWSSDEGWGGLWRWARGLFGGGLGLLGGIFAGLLVAVVVVLLFALFTAPLWIVFLLLYLVIRSGRRRDAGQMASAYNRSAAPAATPAGATPAGAAAAGAASQAASSASASSQHKPGGYYAKSAAGPRQQQSFQLVDENQETWKDGVRQSAIGAGFFICYFILHWKILLVLGVVLICLGVAKLVIATTTKGKTVYRSTNPQQESFVTGLGDDDKKTDAPEEGV